jgi:hypothetical protein
MLTVSRGGLKVEGKAWSLAKFCKSRFCQKVGETWQSDSIGKVTLASQVVWATILRSTTLFQERSFPNTWQCGKVTFSIICSLTTTGGTL